MAGIEQLEIHSKSYLIRWIQVAAGNTISWSLQPHKKSISFGIFKHPGGTTNGADTNTYTPALSSTNTFSENTVETGRRSRSGSLAKPLAQTQSNTGKSETVASVTEKLQSLGMRQVSWIGKCEADIVITGQYDVPEGETGMYGMVFDNTHSKQLSKQVTFVVMTFPTSVAPKSAQQTSFRQVLSSRQRASSTGRSSPSLVTASDQGEPLAPTISHKAIMPELSRRASKGLEVDANGEPTFFTGVLSKKRRKRNQGWARRFFSLDFTSSTLSYYKSRNSSALRGAIPLSLAAVGADEKSRYISVDSGAEIWILRAHNQQEFNDWWNALEKASQRQPPLPTPSDAKLDGSAPVSSYANDRDWHRAENLVGKVAGITDSVRRLAKDTDPKYMTGLGLSQSPQGSPTPTEVDGEDYFNGATARSRFGFRRKSSHQGRSPSGAFRQTFSSQNVRSPSLNIPGPGSLAIPKQRSFSNMSSKSHSGTEAVHDRCMAVLRDLDAVVAQFSSLINDSRRRRQPERPTVATRNSMESTLDEFFDAEDGLQHSRSQILRIRGDSEAEAPSPDESQITPEAEEVEDSGSESELDEAADANTSRPGQSSMFPNSPATLTPLPLPPITRRTTLLPSTAQPPSLIAFLRKNVGKDLSTISMPVTANEPLSLLQRQAETLEYSSLLDTACTLSATSGERLLYITAFALSSLSSSRAKERASRKPFNPMLGETFEYVSPEGGYRFLAEKISHRPVRVACQAESEKWTFTHSPSPSQKFWGKSAEITTDGKARVRLHATTTKEQGSKEHQTGADCYSWTPATSFLRNIIAGEKYIEPVSTLTVYEESTGRKAVATFKAGGMFSGRSEEVSVAAYDPSGQQLPLGLSGKWTTSLLLTGAGGSGAGTEIWRAGSLVPDAAKRYGMTSFAATLNEVTSIEGGGSEGDGRGKALPPTDSRNRPDQRLYENGQVDEAETLKAKLEEAQRRRRKEMETSGEQWEPRWFGKVGEDGGEDVWALKGVKGGEDYWGVRRAVVDLKRGRWDGVREVFEV